MRTARPGWLAMLASVALMAALTTLFQLTLPRLRSDWIVSAVDQHSLVMQATAGGPWQYRVLSDYLADPIIRGFAAAQGPDPYQQGLLAFVFIRATQMVCLFGLGFVYFQKLGLGLIASVVGLAMVCGVIVVGQIETNWQMDAYTDVVLYVLAAVLVLSRHFAAVIPIAVLAALNRETGAFIPLMPLAFVNVRALRSSGNLSIYRAVGVGSAVFVVVSIGLHVLLPLQDVAPRLVPEVLVSTLKIRGAYAYAAIAIGTLPILGALGIRTEPGFIRYLFWLVVPAWMATHAWGNVSMTPIAFLVPLVLVFVPGTLFTVSALWAKNHPFLASADEDGRGVRWEPIAALVAVYLVGPVLAGVVRLDFPFPLERIEGAMLQEVRRVALGQGVYVAPSLDYVPMLYTPVYVYVSAAVGLFTGLGLVPMRIVSLAAAIGSAVLISRLVARDAPGRLAGFLAAGLFLGTTQLTPTDRFPARVDQLCLLLLLAAASAARAADRQPQAAPQLSGVCGSLLGLAILTKQTAVVVGLPLLLLGVPRFRQRVVPYVAAAAATVGAATLILLTTSDGWARFYLVDLPRNHGLEWSMLAGLWTLYLLPNAGLALVFGAAFFLARGRREVGGAVRFYALTAAGLIGMSWAGVLNPGGGANSMAAAYAGLAMLFGLGFQQSLARARARSIDSRWLTVGLVLAAALALARVNFSSDQPAPLRANARAGERLTAAIAALPGPVFAPDVEEYQRRAGKGDHATAAGAQELFGSFGGTILPAGRQYLDALDRALAERQYAYVLFDPEGFDLGLRDRLTGHGYEMVGPLMRGDAEFFQLRRGASSGGGYLTPSPILYAPRKGPA